MTDEQQDYPADPFWCDHPPVLRKMTPEESAKYGPTQHYQCPQCGCVIDGEHAVITDKERNQ